MSGDSTPGAAVSDTERDNGFTFVSQPASSSVLTMRPKQDEAKPVEDVPQAVDEGYDEWDADLESDANDEDEGLFAKSITKKSSVSTIRAGKMPAKDDGPSTLVSRPAPEQKWDAKPAADVVNGAKNGSPYADPNDKGKRKASDAGESPRAKLRTKPQEDDSSSDSDGFEWV